MPLAIKNLRLSLERKKGQRDQIKNELKEAKNKLLSLNSELDISLKSQAIIQKIAKETQEQLQFHISHLVTTALKAVFKKPYKFKVEFVVRRGKTECDLLLERNGIVFYDPLREVGGGVIDIASFALRIALWSLTSPRTRNTLIFDEPFKNINDKTRKLHHKLADMVKMISEKLKVQIIMVTMIPEMEDIADKVFLLNLKKGKTKII